ncbi:MAG: hypothetical protein OXR73_07040, partial [Myxococcales bacterium]|nr:hypothetical protein [Myxococcales bacterium]
MHVGPRHLVCLTLLPMAVIMGLSGCTLNRLARCHQDGGCPDVTACEYDGQQFAEGERFPSADGCNTCTCAEGGLVACTERACVDFCGGIAGVPCPAGQFCDFPAGTQCGAGDQAGQCVTPPEACTAVFDPVCGCDGMTYGNACMASAAQVSVLSAGPCDVDASDGNGSAGNGPGSTVGGPGMSDGDPRDGDGDGVADSGDGDGDGVADSGDGDGDGDGV